MQSPKINRRAFLRGAALTGLVVSAQALAGCTQPAAAPTTAPKAAATAPAGAAATTAPAKAPAASGGSNLRFISNHGAADQPFFKKVVDNFHAANSNIKIEHLDVAGTEFYDTINAQGAAGQLPDVWYTRTFDVPVYANKAWTVDLQPLIDRDAKEVNADDFWPAEVEQMKWKGHLYALPYDFSNMGIFFNKKMYDEAKVALPGEKWTFDQFAETALKFVKKTGNDFTTWGTTMGFGAWTFHGIVLGWGGKLFNADFTDYMIDTPETLKLVNWFVENRKKGLYPEAGAMPTGVDVFASGMVANSMNGSWATTSMRSTVGDKFDFDVTAHPVSNDGKNCISAAGGAWGIAKNSKAVEDAWKWNKFLTSTESTNILISEPVRSIPGRKSSVPMWTEKATAGGKPPKNAQVFAKQMDGAQAAPFPPFWQDYSRAWDNQMVPMLNGTTKDDPKTVLAAFQTEIKRIIAQQPK